MPVLAIMLVSYLMIVLDISIVITALPKIRHELAFTATGLSWVQNAYTLAFGGLRGHCDFDCQRSVSEKMT